MEMRVKTVLPMSSVKKATGAALSLFAAFASAVLGAEAETGKGFSLDPLFSEGAVLQRDAEIPVSGDGASGARVEVGFDGRSYPATVGEDGKAVDGFSVADCEAFARADSTKTELRFKGRDLSPLVGKPVRFRFCIHCGTLYSFWVSPSDRGESCGYVAAGGPAYKGLRDL